jgi:hypothetical protein
MYHNRLAPLKIISVSRQQFLKVLLVMKQEEILRHAAKPICGQNCENVLKSTLGRSSESVFLKKLKATRDMAHGLPKDQKFEPALSYLGLSG